MIYALLTSLFAVLTLADFFAGHLTEPLRAALLLIIVALSAAGSGRFFIGRAGLPDLSDSQRTLLGFTLGLGLLCAGLFGLAAVGLLRFWAAAALLGAMWLVGFTELRAMAVSLSANRNLLSDRPVAAAGIVAALVLLWWSCWAPPHQYDSLVYHLTLPADYIRAGGFTAPEHLVYAHFPQNAELLFTLALLLKSDLLAQMLMWLATTLSVWWVFESGKREAPLAAVLLACGLLVTHTSVMLLAGTTYVEPLLMLWTTAAVLSFYRWLGMTGGQSGQRTWLVLSAIFCGLALGVKYNAGITPLILGGILAWRAGRSPGRARALDLLLFTGVVTALFMPWLVKNAYFAGNPVFPFFHTLFPSTAHGWQGESAKAYFQVLVEYGHGGDPWSALLKLPIMLLSNSQRFGGGMDALGTTGWELSFWALPLAIWAARGNRYLRGLLVYLGLHMAFWFCTRVVLRFLIPVAPLLCLAAGVGLHALWTRLTRPGRFALGFGVAALTLTHLMLYAFMHGVFGTFSAAAGLEDRAGWLKRRLEYYECADWASGRLDENAKVLLVGEQRAYGLSRAHVATTVNAPNRFVEWADQAANPAALAKKLVEQGFTHLLIVPNEFQRLAPGMGLTDKARENLSNLNPAPVFKGARCGVFSVQ